MNEVREIDGAQRRSRSADGVRPLSPTGGGIRTGVQYAEGLRDGRTVFVDGKTIHDVTAYGPFQGVIETLSDLFDSQHTAAYRDTTTFSSPTSGLRVTKTFYPARTAEEFQERLECDSARADRTYGFLGRLPDFMNAGLLDMEAALRFMGRTEAVEKTRALIAHVRENDLVLTHTLIDPQSDRSQPGPPKETVRVVERRSNGIVVSGARLLSTLAPVSDEVLLSVSVPRAPGEEDYANTFTVPMNAPGLKILCRESYDKGLGSFNRPLSSRFDEGDAILIFEDVFVPAERVILSGDIEAYNGIRSYSPGYTGLQANIRSATKLRFLTGLAAIAARVTGRNKVSHFQEMIGELVAQVAIADGLLQGICHEVSKRTLALEEGRKLKPGVSRAAVAHFFPYWNTRAIDTIKMIAGSGPIAMTVEDYVNPEIKDSIDRFLIGAGFDARRRLEAMKLVWDTTGEQFGSRQTLYENFYVGDPVRNLITQFAAPQRIECESLVERLLGWEKTGRTE